MNAGDILAAPIAASKCLVGGHLVIFLSSGLIAVPQRYNGSPYGTIHITACLRCDIVYGIVAELDTLTTKGQTSYRELVDAAADKPGAYIS